MRFGAAAGLMLLACGSTPVRAQQSVTIAFDGGRVTLSAQNAPVRAILAEWSRLGGATIVNGDRVIGPPVTLELSGVPERQALDIVLRNVAGYMLAPRPAGATGASSFDRILILATSAAPPTPPPAAANATAPRRPLQPPFRRQPPPAESSDDSGGGNGASEPDPGDRPAVGARPGVRATVPRPAVPSQVAAEPADADEDEEQSEPPPDAVAPTPANPFGVPFGSSPRPGVTTPAPQPPTGRRPPQ